ncbi:stonustoxin subunit alpha-like [Haplochromis burtoni]|uniref:stonustoxin subunit alpha-like n=1 Tax=Haplochromis burtoni TaxID=8153 RepID=UPI001C2CF41F|nr:stonustoxin subunit alpha-like [Haplochromis burtoni]
MVRTRVIAMRRSLTARIHLIVTEITKILDPSLSQRRPLWQLLRCLRKRKEKGRPSSVEVTRPSMSFSTRVWEEAGKGVFLPLAVEETSKRTIDQVLHLCDLTLDPNTAHRNLKLSDDKKEVTHVKEDQLYPHHDHRFDPWPQLLCTNSLSGRCYWEVEWSGEVHVAVAYGGIRRRGEEDESRFGRTYQSWSLYCRDNTGHYGNHDYIGRAIPLLPSALSHKVAVYVDCSAGTVSFYSVSSDKLIHLHTFNTTFTEPVYAGFRVKPDSSIHLCADSE